MDFGNINKKQSEQTLNLQVRALSKSDIRDALPYVNEYKYNGSKLDLLDPKIPSWTIVVGAS